MSYFAVEAHETKPASLRLAILRSGKYGFSVARLACDGGESERENEEESAAFYEQ